MFWIFCCCCNLPLGLNCSCGTFRGRLISRVLIGYSHSWAFWLRPHVHISASVKLPSVSWAGAQEVGKPSIPTLNKWFEDLKKCNHNSKSWCRITRWRQLLSLLGLFSCLNIHILFILFKFNSVFKWWGLSPDERCFLDEICNHFPYFYVLFSLNTKRLNAFQCKTQALFYVLLFWK